MSKNLITRLYFAFLTLFGQHPVEGNGEVFESKMNNKKDNYLKL